MSNLRDFISRVTNWRTLAKKQEDGFLRFALEYFAFNALLKAVLSPNQLAGQDRRLIDMLKQDENCEAHVNADAALYIKHLKFELDRSPLVNLTRSNSSVTIRSEDNWSDVVEAVYLIRNNLFHGEKRPGDERDQKLVDIGYHLLRSFNDYLIIRGSQNS